MPTFMGFGARFPKWRHPERHLLVRKHIFWVTKRENRSSGTTYARDRKKGQDSQKSQKGVIFHLVGEKPNPTDLHQIYVVVTVPDIIRCAKVVTQIFWGYDFTPDWIFGFYRATACNATHGIAVAILSVCPSLCLSVRQMRVLWQN